MSLQSLSHLLDRVQGRYRGQEPQQLQQLLCSWEEAVGPVVAAQTQPLTIQRGVLKVATSSAAWAQNLVFERQRILDKLNRTMTVQITDIRFSTAQWSRQPLTASFPGDAQQAELWQGHPSRLGNQGEIAPSSLTNETPLNPVSAFQQWATIMRSRTQRMPLCPECHCPTPVGELNRWQVCSICASKRW